MSKASINPAKSKIMLFGRKKAREKITNELNIILNDVKMDCVDSTKNLGLEIDTDLRFSNHVLNKTKVAFVNLKLIYAHRQILNSSTKKLLCDALVLSHFNFGDVVYGPCLTVVDSQRIQRVQNSCVRLVCGLRGRRGVSASLRMMNWLTMLERRLLHSLVLFNKIINYSSPPYLYNKIKFRTDVHNINIRSKHLISCNPHSTAIYERSFSFNVYKFYNKLPPLLKTTTSFKFKNRVKKLIFENFFKTF